MQPSNYPSPTSGVQKVRSAYVLLGNSRLFSMASFRNVYTSLLLVIAGSTDRELARRGSYLKAENQILRSRLPGRISLTEREKNRLIRFAKNVGSALNELTTIVQNPANSDPVSEHGRLCRAIRSNDPARMPRSFRRFWPQTHGPPLPRIQRLLSRRTASSGTGERACD